MCSHHSGLQQIVEYRQQGHGQIRGPQRFHMGIVDECRFDDPSSGHQVVMAEGPTRADSGHQPEVFELDQRRIEGPRGGDEVIGRIVCTHTIMLTHAVR